MSPSPAISTPPPMLPASHATAAPVADLSDTRRRRLAGIGARRTPTKTPPLPLQSAVQPRPRCPYRRPATREETPHPMPLPPTCNSRGNAAPAAPSADLRAARGCRPTTRTLPVLGGNSEVSTSFCHAATLDELSWYRFSGMLPRILLYITDLKSKAGGTIDSRLDSSLNLIKRINWSFLNTVMRVHHV
jgi:hypothetical protein